MSPPNVSPSTCEHCCRVRPPAQHDAPLSGKFAGAAERIRPQQRPLADCGHPPLNKQEQLPRGETRAARTHQPTSHVDP